MVTTHAITALRDKRGELAGQIDALQDQLRQAFIDMDHRNASLRMFVPDIGVMDSEPNIRNKISRGKFTAVFLVQCLTAIGVAEIRM
tara:strand:+ start:2569 stop:2829 length:261 start_codon:yes stop_codon:yes gene_type:complete